MNMDRAIVILQNAMTDLILLKTITMEHQEALHFLAREWCDKIRLDDMINLNQTGGI